MANPVSLTYHVSATLLAELTQNGNNNGVNAYLWYNSYAAGGGSSPFTTVITNGVATGGTFNATTGTTDWDLTLTTDPVANPVEGGKVYLIIQSNPTSTPTINDLTTLLTSEASITPANAVAYNFSYDTFEVALANSTGDVADLSAINSFGHQFGISAVVDGAVVTRGYDSTNSATDIGGQIDTAASELPGAVPGSPVPVINFPAGSTLANQGMIAITPATDNGDQAPSGYGNIWQPSNWQDYVTTVSGLTGVELVGHFNGATDASGVYHSAGYYDYKVTSQVISGNPNLADGTYFVLSPGTQSQIKGYLVISEASLMSNLYSPGLATAPAYVFSDAALQNPYGSTTGEMDTGANNQWGDVFTQLFTGFTGGYYGGTGQSIPTHEGAPNAPIYTVDLNQSYNWDPTYAFDGARESGTILTGQHYDPYAKIFFDTSNVYGTAYGDALTANFTTSVTLPVYTGAVGTGSNVSNIDLWAFGATEKMTTVPGTGGAGQPPLTNFYAPYTVANYIAPPVGADYAVATEPSIGNSLSLTLANNGMVVNPDTADIQLGIYLGNGQFQYLSLPSGAAQNGGGPWQVWKITQDTSLPAGQQYAIESIPIPGNFNNDPPQPYIPYTSSDQVGSLSFDDLPAAAGGTNWYQLVVGGKTFNFYATLDGSSNVTAVAADGLASVTPPTGSSPTAISLSVVPGFMDALPGSVMEAYATATTISAVVPTSAVAGTLSGPSTALVLAPLQTGAGEGQSVDTNASVYLTAAASLGFGWTGLSDAVNKPSWISAATNKVTASNLAYVDAVDLATGLSVMSWYVAPDIDGQWLTPTSFNFTDGAYAVTMTEVLSDLITPYGLASSPVYIVVSATGAIVDTAAHLSGALAAYQAVNTSLTSITVSDNQAITVSWAGIIADAAALALVVNADHSPYTLNVVDSSTTIMANIASLNGNAKVAGIGFTDATAPTLTFTYDQFTTTYSTAIGVMEGARTIAVTGVTPTSTETYTSFNQVYTHGVLSTGANGAGVLEMTQQFTSNYSHGNITLAPTWEHDVDWMNRAVRDIYSSATGTSNGVTVVSAALPSVYQSGGDEARDTFTSVEYDYANGVAAPMQSTFTFANAGPGGSVGEVDVFDVNNNLISQTLTGFGPLPSNNYKSASETTYAMINGAQAVTSTTTFYQYSEPVNGNHYTLAQETLDSSGRILQHVFSGLFGLEGEIFSSYEDNFLGGTHNYSGSKYYSNSIEGLAYTGLEVNLDMNGHISKLVFTGVTSQPYSSYEYDYSYDNGAWGGGGVVGQTYYYTNVAGQSYLSYEVNLDGTGAITSIVYSGYSVTASQPYATLEYFYSGGSLTGAYNAYVTNIAGKNWTGEEHVFNTSGDLVSQIFTGVTSQPYTSYENDFANGDGTLTGQKYYYTNIQNQHYSSYQVDLTSTGAAALQVYNMNDGSHTINGLLATPQTINSIYNDLMTGGSGADTFSFTPYFGQATVTDFTSGTDKISLSTSEFADYAYVQAHSAVVSGNTVITATNGDSITLNGITTLHQSDFLFV